MPDLTTGAPRVSLLVAVASICLIAIGGAAGAQSESEVTRAEKVSGLEGEKVRLLPQSGSQRELSYHTQCYLIDELEKLQRETEYSQYAGKTGTVTEASIRPDGFLRLLVALDESDEILTFCEIESLGFFAEMEFAKSLVGRTLWNRRKLQLQTDCSEYPQQRQPSGAIDVPILSPLVVTDAAWGFFTSFGSAVETSRIPIILSLKTPSQSEGCLVDKIAFVDDFNVGAQKMMRISYQEAFDDFFHLEDPRNAHSDWSDDIWSLIRKGRVAIGMTEAMAEMACGGQMEDEGYIVSGPGVATIYKCPEGDRFVIEGGKVTKYAK